MRPGCFFVFNSNLLRVNQPPSATKGLWKFDHPKAPNRHAGGGIKLPSPDIELCFRLTLREKPRRSAAVNQFT